MSRLSSIRLANDRALALRKIQENPSIRINRGLSKRIKPQDFQRRKLRKPNLDRIELSLESRKRLFSSRKAPRQKPSSPEVSPSKPQENAPTVVVSPEPSTSTPSTPSNQPSEPDFYQELSQTEEMLSQFDPSNSSSKETLQIAMGSFHKVQAKATESLILGDISQEQFDGVMDRISNGRALTQEKGGEILSSNLNNVEQSINDIDFTSSDASKEISSLSDSLKDFSTSLDKTGTTFLDPESKAQLQEKVSALEEKLGGKRDLVKASERVEHVLKSVKDLGNVYQTSTSFGLARLGSRASQLNLLEEELGEKVSSGSITQKEADKLSSQISNARKTLTKKGGGFADRLYYSETKDLSGAIYNKQYMFASGRIKSVESQVKKLYDTGVINDEKFEKINVRLSNQRKYLTKAVESDLQSRNRQTQYSLASGADGYGLTGQLSSITSKMRGVGKTEKLLKNMTELGIINSETSKKFTNQIHGFKNTASRLALGAFNDEISSIGKGLESKYQNVSSLRKLEMRIAKVDEILSSSYGQNVFTEEQRTSLSEQLEAQKSLLEDLSNSHKS